jgi:hypothetical protein
MTTIVSAFLSDVNHYRKIEEYIEYGKKLVNLPIHKVIFIEYEIYNKYFKIEATNIFTVFLFIKRENLYLYEYLDTITEFCVNTDNPSKDTAEYMFAICNKTEWMRKAINMNPHCSDQFVWIDFGIWHVIKDDEIFTNSCVKLAQTVHKWATGVRIASGGEIYLQNPNVYQYISWFFLGGVFGGNRESLIQFAELVKQECIDTIKEKRTIMWEVNIWHLVYEKHPSLFNYYYADHNESILLNW